MRIILFYNSSQTYTNTVYEHVDAFRRYSTHDLAFCHHDGHSDTLTPSLDAYDAVIVHYSIRLPLDQVSEGLAAKMEAFDGIKVLLIQDEYDHTYRAWYWIERLGFHIVFTTVPQKSISHVYPPERFPGVRFVSNLTGYVPESLPRVARILPPPQRRLMVAYRGRPLPLRYGLLGIEKVRIGQMVKAYCEQEGIQHDIAWTEEARIYGPKWYEFTSGTRSMLGTESGSNVFDWDGTLSVRIAETVARRPELSDEQIYDLVVKPLEQPGLMNQISPRVFEAIALKTVLVMFEGSYSGILEAGRHYLALKKDGSNLRDVFAALHDSSLVDRIAQHAFDDIIGSRRYSYECWVETIDKEMAAAAARRSFSPRECERGHSAAGQTRLGGAVPADSIAPLPADGDGLLFFPRWAKRDRIARTRSTPRPSCVTAMPIRAKPPQPTVTSLASAILEARSMRQIPRRLASYLWQFARRVAWYVLRLPRRVAYRIFRSLPARLREPIRAFVKGGRVRHL